MRAVCEYGSELPGSVKRGEALPAEALPASETGLCSVE
jgi:hypothetical protein